MKIFTKAFDFLCVFVNNIFPLRSDFVTVRKLSELNVHSLPKALEIYGKNWIKATWKYKDYRVKAMIWELKYHENILPLGIVGKIMYEEIIDKMSEILLFDSDAKFLLLPIPISTERRIERGYNQSEHLAKAILENDLGHFLLYAPQWFSKTRDTPRQSRSHSKQERMKNLANCFEANPAIVGYYVFLIDDVVTTGSTLDEARKTLLEIGARNVWAFTIAH